jgi:transposase
LVVNTSILLKNFDKEVNRKVKEELRIRSIVTIIEFISKSRNVRSQCRDFGIPKSTYYLWKKKYDLEGKEGLKRKKPIPYKHPKQTPPEVIEKILELRKEYQIGPDRIK